MDIFENLENLNVSEECFDDIMDIVEAILDEGRLIDDKGRKTDAYYDLKNKMIDKLTTEKGIQRGLRKNNQKVAKKSTVAAKDIEKNVIPDREYKKEIAWGNSAERDASYTHALNTLGKHHPQTKKLLALAKEARAKDKEAYDDLETAKYAASGKRWNAYVHGNRAKDAQEKVNDAASKLQYLQSN